LAAHPKEKQEIISEKGRRLKKCRPFNISKSEKRSLTIMQNLSKYRLCSTMDTTPSGKLLFLIMLDIINTDNSVIIPQRRISEVLGISKGTVSRNLQKLRDNGYINVIPQYHSDGGRAANKYILK